MKYNCATTIPVTLTQYGRNYFPLVQKLDGKKIYSISFCDCWTTDDTANIGYLIARSLTLSLTEDGHYYPIKNLPLNRINLEYTKGTNLAIERYLSTQDCYIYVPDSATDAIGKTVVLLVWYEQDGYAGYNSEVAQYDNFEVAVDFSKLRNYFPDDRTLAGKSFTRFFVTGTTSTTEGTYPAYSPSDKQLLSVDDLRKLRITLVKGSFEVWDKVPAIILLQENWYRYLALNNIVFDFESSYIEVCKNATGTNGTLNINVKF